MSTGRVVDVPGGKLPIQFKLFNQMYTLQLAPYYLSQFPINWYPIILEVLQMNIVGVMQLLNFLRNATFTKISDEYISDEIRRFIPTFAQFKLHATVQSYTNTKSTGMHCFTQQGATEN